MFETDKGLAKSLLSAAMLNVVPLKMIEPELGRALGDRISSGLNLARAGTALHALIRKGRIDRARFRVGVGIIQMVMGVSAVKEYRLLDESLTGHRRLKIDVFLGAAGANGDVMDSCYERHISLPCGDY